MIVVCPHLDMATLKHVGMSINLYRRGEVHVKKNDCVMKMDTHTCEYSTYHSHSLKVVYIPGGGSRI